MKKSLKIGLVSAHSFSRPGGVKNHALSLQKELSKRGHSVKIILPRHKFPEHYGKDFRFLGTSFIVSILGTQSDFTVCFNPQRINRLLKKESFDILHFHNFGFHSWQVLDRSRTTNVLTFHTHSTIKGVNSTPWIRIIFPFLHFLRKGTRKSLKKTIETISPLMHGVIGVSPLCIKLIRELGYNGKTTVIPNGIDAERFNPKAPKIQKYLDGKINLLFLSRIEKRKGLIYLLSAYRILKKKYPNLRLIVVGDGNLKEKYQSWAKEKGLEDVIFEGRVSDKKVPSYYTTCDIFIAPAIFGESFGIILLEAMACCKPVVAFANEGYKSVLTGIGEEFLVKLKDSKQLAKKIEVLIKDEEKRREMAEWGQKEVQKYSWAVIADQVLDFYEEAMIVKNRQKL